MLGPDHPCGDALLLVSGLRLLQSRQRRNMLDVLMREQETRQMTNPAPLIPAAP
jgi:hypothetical protein